MIPQHATTLDSMISALVEGAILIHIFLRYVLWEWFWALQERFLLYIVVDVDGSVQSGVLHKLGWGLFVSLSSSGRLT